MNVTTMTDVVVHKIGLNKMMVDEMTLDETTYYQSN
jgi:hypothetical protein